MLGRCSTSFLAEVPSTTSNSSWAFFCAPGHSIMVIRNALIMVTDDPTLTEVREVRAGLIMSVFSLDNKRLLIRDWVWLP